jgi:cysteine-rich repeat protein
MRHARSLLAAASAFALLSPTLTARADTTAQSLPFSQNWSNPALITTSDDWSGVPGITGFRGDGLTGSDPQTILVADSPGVVDVNANQTNPNTFATGGVTEFDLSDDVVALAGSGTAGAPYLLVTLATTGRTSVVVTYNLRDIDGSTDNAVQPVALQYRIGTSGVFTNVPAGFVADASSGPSLATLVTPVTATLPAAANDQSVVQLRIMTVNASGNDEWIGIDDISITGTPITGPVCGNGIVESAGEEGCDDGNTMDGDCCSSFCQIEEVGTLCRDAVDFECDVPEYCDGASPVCPADVLEPNGTLCGFPKGGPPIATCDAQDSCEAGFCVNRVEPAGTTCRSSMGTCDPAEVCDGSSDVCPEDSYASSSVVCRAAAGACDAAERCDGFNVDCPADVFLAATVCRAAAGVCDSAEFCDGSSARCPTDSVLPLGTLCRASTGACDPAESCNGFAVCPADRTAADGTTCSDGTVCNGAETCAMGSCRPGTALSCDDRNACTADACAEPGGCENNPIAGCCNVDRDCADDGNVCTAERCSGSGGTCERLPITGCCTTDSDCTGGSACTTVSCNLATNRCESAPVPSCCTSDADCGDGLPCTSDSCDRATGTCSNTTITDCCAGDGDCDDGNSCSTDSCTIGAGGAGTCAASPIMGCCLGDSDCMDEDGSACTTPSCNVTTERCMETLVRCDDMDECTSDTCEVDGSCSHTPVTCDDGDDCTADACSAGACEHTPIDGCGMMPDAGMMGMDAGMPMPDAALPDAGLSNDAALTRIDAPVDTGPLEVIDTGIGTGDGGPIELMDTSGCDRCAATPDRSTRGLWLALGVLGLVLARTRTRRRVR